MSFLWALFGLLLNYPECCIKARCLESRISHNGFVPCRECSKLTSDQLLEKMGRKDFNTPDEFTEFINKPSLSYKSGKRIYKKYGKEDHFEKCWARAEELT